MCLCTLCSRRFLAAAVPASAFLDHCHSRDLPRVRNAADRHEVTNWRDAVAALPTERRLAVEREVEAACDLGTREGNAHLLGASAPHDRPPPGVQPGVPLALWYLLRRSGLFWDVHAAHEDRAADEWHAARVPAGLRASGLRVATTLAATLGALLFGQAPAGAAGPVTAHEIGGGAVCVVAAGHEGRQRARARARPAASCPSGRGLHLAYYPKDGSLLLRPPPAPDSAAFARAALARAASEVLGGDPGAPAFDLDALKAPFRPPPDAPDMESARVKTLHLRYPDREGRRLLALDTLPGDSAWSIDEMLAEHAGGAAERLTVTHAVLQVRLVDEGGRPRNHLVRLWPGRCDLGRGALGDRMLRCLRLWGL